MTVYTLNAMDRETCETVVENYATFDTYQEARDFADRHEMEARRCGWTWVVVPVVFVEHTCAGMYDLSCEACHGGR